MNTAHERLDAASPEVAGELLAKCCGSKRWVARMLEHRPFLSDATLRATADAAWADLDRADYLEAFSHHPRLGEDMAKLRAKFHAADWSAGEQSGVAAANEATLEALRAGNAAYEARFGFVFLVCASGKSADEMLALLTERLAHDRATELAIAAAEHAKITRLRLAGLAT